MRASKINLRQIFSHFKAPEQNKIKTLSSTKKPTKHTIVQKLPFRSKMETFAKMPQTVNQVAVNITPVLI